MAPREEKTASAVQLKRPKRLPDIPDAKRRRVLAVRLYDPTGGENTTTKRGKPRVLQNAVIHLFL
jgi:hypothetical protein